MASFQSLQDALKGLQKSKDLTVCNLTGVEVRDAGVSDLLFALRKQTKITELILSNCRLGPQGAVHLATFLKYNKTVTRLYLQHNPDLGDKGIEELAAVLRFNKTLQVLNLANCGVGDIGAAALAEHFQNNDACSLKKLYLYNNKVGYIGASALAEMILQSATSNKTTLEELFLWDNPLTNDGLKTLEEAYEATGKKDDTSFSTAGRMQVVTGLKNKKLSKENKPPPPKRNFKLPTRKTGSEPDIDDARPGDFAELRAKARELEAAPSPAPKSPPPRKTGASINFAELLAKTESLSTSETATTTTVSSPKPPPTNSPSRRNTPLRAAMESAYLPQKFESTTTTAATSTLASPKTWESGKTFAKSPVASSLSKKAVIPPQKEEHLEEEQVLIEEEESYYEEEIIEDSDDDDDDNDDDLKAQRLQAEIEALKRQLATM